MGDVESISGLTLLLPENNRSAWGGVLQTELDCSRSFELREDACACVCGPGSTEEQLGLASSLSALWLVRQWWWGGPLLLWGPQLSLTRQF